MYTVYTSTLYMYIHLYSTCIYTYIVHVHVLYVNLLPSPSFLLVIFAALLSNSPKATAASSDRIHQPKPGHFK